VADEPMKALTVLYHDVVEDDFDESGFPGAAAARYKIRRTDFAEHLAAMYRRAGTPAVAAETACFSLERQPFFFTIDDGGSSAIHIADALQGVGWRGNFFITTDLIGAKGFVSADDIRRLHVQGHIVGSHSCSHPYRMSDLSDGELQNEWGQSIAVLSDILGSRIDTASVPGGFYTPRVGLAARHAGIRVLFNSEPTTQVLRIDDCFIVGRFNVYGGMSASAAARLAGGDARALLTQQVAWATKKTIKTVAAPLWDRARASFFRKRDG
jgi:peptidoglycan/xylan/chitin deacetylase (PgdA/CDA1 family)